MPKKQTSIALASSVALWLLLGSALRAAEEAAGKEAPPRPEIGEPFLPSPPAKLPRPEMEGPRPRGPRQGPGPGRPGDFLPRRGLQTQPPGPIPGSPPDRPGPGKRFGGPDQPGRGRPDHPGGPPRWPHHDWDALQKNDPQMYKLLLADRDYERRTRELAVQYRRAPATQRAAIKQKLEETLGRHFEVRQQRRLLELKRLEEELKRLREAIDLRNDARDELIGKRISQLLGEDEGLEF